MVLAARLLLIPLLMAVLAFCLAAELALLRLRPTQVQELTPINPLCSRHGGTTAASPAPCPDPHPMGQLLCPAGVGLAGAGTAPQ